MPDKTVPDKPVSDRPAPRPGAHARALARRLIAPDLAAAQGREDLAGRLAAKGFALRDSEAGLRLVTLPHGVDLGPPA